MLAFEFLIQDRSFLVPIVRTENTADVSQEGLKFGGTLDVTNHDSPPQECGSFGCVLFVPSDYTSLFPARWW